MSDMPNKAADVLTSIVRRASDILFVENPRGTSVGAFFGVAAHTAVSVFEPFFRRFSAMMDVTRLTWYGAVAVGVFLFNIPTIFRKRQLPKEIEDEFELIRRMKKELPAWQVKARYLLLCERVTASVTPRAPRKAAPR
jgi:hypothetical protein